MNSMLMLSVLYFLLAGLMEIGGGYLVWLWLREHQSWWLGLIGALVLVGYSIVPTFQPAHFGRVYAAYGGVFVFMSMLWGWWIDGQRPDRWDLVGSALCIAGVIVIMYTPRGHAA
jgi:small multidrug resistance family-3 protein